jgi:uncharacterized membrane protein YobD (UPF0266 family)
MLMLNFFIVMLPIILPSGARAVADLLEKEGTKITLAMKVSYIALLTLCICAYVPAGVYVGKEWGFYFGVVYFILGYFLIVAIINFEDDDEGEDEEPDPRANITIP